MIEYEGAIYHVMARGNHRKSIVFSDQTGGYLGKPLMRWQPRPVGSFLPGR